MFRKFIKWRTVEAPGGLPMPSNIKSASLEETLNLLQRAEQQGYSRGISREQLAQISSEQQRFYIQPRFIERSPEECYSCVCVTRFFELGWRQFRIDIGEVEFGITKDVTEEEFFELLGALMNMPPSIRTAEKE